VVAKCYGLYEVVGNGFSSDCVPHLVGTFGLQGAWECAGAEREEEAAWRSSQISTMLPLTSQLSGSEHRKIWELFLIPCGEKKFLSWILSSVVLLPSLPKHLFLR
jgi:hypothetical protein